MIAENTVMKLLKVEANVSARDDACRTVLLLTAEYECDDFIRR